MDLASGGGLNGTTVERNYIRRTGMRGVPSVGGVAASWEDSDTYIQVCFLCAVCAFPKFIHKMSDSVHCRGPPNPILHHY